MGHARAAGAIEVPAGLDLVLVEGVGAGRRELANLLDAVVRVQSDFAEAERRSIARDLAQGVNGDAQESIDQRERLGCIRRQPRAQQGGT